MKTQVFCKSVFSLSKKFLVVFGPKLDAIITWRVWTLNNCLFSKTTVNPLRKKMVQKWSKFWSKNRPSSCRVHTSSSAKILFFSDTTKNLSKLPVCSFFDCFYILSQKKKLKLLRWNFTEGFIVNQNGPEFFDLVQLPFPPQ